jgi:DNA invertase Pin-like site-specific DNA recombinase
MQRYVTYKRVSTKKQGESGLGLEAQERDIDLFLETYSEEPWEVLGDYTDILSGSNDRPELQKAIALATENKATLLVAKLDRLSRSVSFIAGLIDNKKLNFRVANMPHADKFQLHIYAALAEQERDFISKRTIAALREAKKRGVLLGGRREGAEKRHAAVKAEADRNAARVIDLIRPLRYEAGQTLQQIADSLNSTGVVTPRGGKWYPASVKNALTRAEAREKGV